MVLESPFRDLLNASPLAKQQQYNKEHKRNRKDNYKVKIWCNDLREDIPQSITNRNPLAVSNVLTFSSLNPPWSKYLLISTSVYLIPWEASSEALHNFPSWLVRRNTRALGSSFGRETQHPVRPAREHHYHCMFSIYCHSASHSSISKKGHFNKPDQTANSIKKSWAKGQNLTQMQDTGGGMNVVVLYYT